MNPGKLDTLIQIECPAVTPGAMGDAVTTWSPLASPFAEVRNLTGRELVEAQQIVAETDTKFVVRYSSTTRNANARCRIRVPSSGAEYDILENLPMPGGRPERLEILAKRRAD